MRELSFGPRIVTVVFVCSFLSSHAEVRNEKVQQVGEAPRTYVVRYKNGDQTIPVTVVLDYKKQTEYVINMNPRTPAKSVTLYDFKQRTIAYKDLTNRECFLGRLTYETLNEETDALNRVQNPINHTAKVLSLDPHRPSLTPTEIRNIAGQRTAVFCRKMNTWLIMPQDSHSVKKRETDEVEERTYHHQGFHTVQYSHYGRETRRRFRNSRRKDSKQLLYENKNTSNSTNSKPEISESNSFFGKNDSPRRSHSSHLGSQAIEKNPIPSPASFSQENAPNIYEKHPSLPNVHNHVNIPREHGVQVPFGSDVGYTASLQHKINERTPDQNHHPLSENKPFRMGQSTALYGRKDTYASDNRDGVENDGAQYVRSPVFTEDTLESKSNPGVGNSAFPYPENKESIYLPERNVFEYRPITHQNRSPVDNKQSQIETDWAVNETSEQSIPERTFPQFNHDVPENPDISTNVLEIPNKNGKKFENLNNQGSPVLIPQPNEDVHDVFEGFYNLRDKHAPSNPNYFHQPQFSPSENDPDRDFVHTETYPIKYFSSHPHNKENQHNVTNNNAHWRVRDFPYSTSDLTSSTENPLFSTFIYDNRHITSPAPFIASNLITSHEKFDTHNSEERTPYNEQTLNSYVQSRVPLEPIFVPGHQLESQNTVPSNYFTTESPVKVQHNYEDVHHRSDIPSETDYGDNVRFNTPTNVQIDTQNKNNHSRVSFVPTDVREGVSAQHVRFQNALHNFQPDEIVIDVEAIPTQRPSESTAGFQDRAFVRNDILSRNSTPFPMTTKKGVRTSQGVWRGTFTPNVRHPSGRINIPKQHPDSRTFRQRQPFVPQQHRGGIREFPHHPANNLHRRGHTQILNAPNQPHHSRTFEQSHSLDALPPGVSIHPRHPNAPYADMFHSNIPPPLPQETNSRTVKAHRQRHHRKKNRLTNCCRGSGKATSNLSSCCRNGGSCCPSQFGKTIASRPSCCTSTKNNRGQFHPSRRNPIAFANKAQELKTPDDTRRRQLYALRKSDENRASSQQDQRSFGDNREVKDFSSRQNRMLVPNDSPQPQQRTFAFEDNTERCAKEKMCRTVYESTQKVLVCRNAVIVGCS